jgi:cytochrome c-type biogenesis protein CcmE
MLYNPKVNPDIFSFFLTDQNGTQRQVNLHKSKPQDFDKSEQIVLIGTIQDSVFEASDILLKCPSKYNETTSR